MTLAEALRLHFSPPDIATWDVPDGWQQGRSTFGGLTFAALAEAAGATLSPGERPLRTLTGEIPAAVAVGRATARTRSLREGHALTAVAAHLEQGGQIVAHAVMNFGKSRDVAFDPALLALPTVPYEAATPHALGPVGPVFTQHFEYRVVRGVPVSGEEDAATEGWVRLRQPGDAPPSIALIAMVDAWFPSVLPVFTAPRPFGTISFAAHLFDRGWQPHEPLYHRSRLLGAQQGYFAELRELWNARGELCAVNQQTMAIIR
jgi:acyl-CoA thioesterase